MLTGNLHCVEAQLYAVVVLMWRNPKSLNRVGNYFKSLYNEKITFDYALLILEHY